MGKMMAPAFRRGGPNKLWVRTLHGCRVVAWAEHGIGRRETARKGQLVDLHKAIGVHAERYPLSGASRFRGAGHDIDVYAHGREQAPLVAEVKSRKNGSGFVQLETWLNSYDLLFLKRNNATPLVLLPWRTYEQFLRRK